MSGPPSLNSTGEEPYSSCHNSRQTLKFSPARLRRPFYAAAFPKKDNVSLELERFLDMLYETPEVSTDTHPNSRGTLSIPPQVKKSPYFHASTRDEALFLCTDTSVVSRDPSNSTIFLPAHKLPEKLHEVILTCPGKPGFPAATPERPRYSPLNIS